GTKFDTNKANWFNQQYLKKRPNSELAQFLFAELEKNNISCTQEKAEQICNELKERVIFQHEFWTEAKYFFIAPEEYDDKVISGKWTGEAVLALTAYRKALLESQDGLTSEEAKQILTDVLEENNIKMGKVMQALRVSITGAGAGPDLMNIINILGREETAKRIEQALIKLNDHVKA